MKVVSNDKLIKRNVKISKILLFGSMILLLLGLFISSNYMMIAIVILLVVLVTFPITLNFMDQWGAQVRPDEQVTQALKGTSERFTLYNYYTEIPQLLVGPGGIFAILPKTVSGMVSYNTKKKWKYKQDGGFFRKVFSSQSIGRPSAEAKEMLKTLQKNLDRCGISNLPKAEVIILFTNDKIKMDIQECPYRVLHAEKINNYIRKLPNLPTEQMQAIAEFQNLLPKE